MKLFRRYGIAWDSTIMVVICFVLLNTAVSADTEIPFVSDWWERYVTSSDFYEFSPDDRDIIRRQWFKENVESLPEFQALPEQERIAIFNRFIEKSIAIEEYVAAPSNLNAMKNAAEEGFAPAQYNLGDAYAEGQGISQDYEKAIEWVKKAAKQGHQRAQYSLGFVYYNGKVVSQDYNEAINWFSKSAEQGYAEAQFYLGYAHLKGRGVPKNSKTALKWFQKAAEQEHSEAQYLLGLAYSSNKSVPQDFQKTIKWWRKAAEKEHVAAQYGLGVIYYKGQGLPQNYNEAIKWYRKAADQGHEKALLNLGIMYHLGQGFPQNYKYAYAMYSLAAAQGNADAVRARDLVAKTLTREQLSHAQGIAATIQNNIDDRKTRTDSPPPPSTPTNEPKLKSFGTGFLVTKDGYILTCQHVVAGATSVKVKSKDRLYLTQVLKTDPANDLALLKIDGNFSALSFSANHSTRMGQEVFTIGYPNPDLQGISPKLTKGEINSLTGFQDDIRLYQISVAVHPGNSGGPLLDMNGNVVGIIVAVLDAKTTYRLSGSLPQNVNYATKSTYAKAFLSSIPDVSEKLSHRWT